MAVSTLELEFPRGENGKLAEEIFFGAEIRIPELKKTFPAQRIRISEPIKLFWRRDLNFGAENNFSGAEI